MQTWVVLVEAATTIPDACVSPALVRSLLTSFDDESPVGLYAPDRYALQVWITAERPEEAMADVTIRWRRAAARAGITGCELVRAEVMTAAELQAEVAVDAPEPAGVPSVVRLQALEAVHQTTRVLLRASSSAQAARAMAALVYRLGGFVVLTDAGDPYRLPFDLSFGRGPAISPAAFPHTATRVLLEQLLPDVVSIAWRILRSGHELEEHPASVRHKADVMVLHDLVIEPPARGRRPG